MQKTATGTTHLPLLLVVDFITKHKAVTVPMTRRKYTIFLFDTILKNVKKKSAPHLQALKSLKSSFQPLSKLGLLKK